MDSAFEKEISVTKLKAAALNHRAQTALALAEIVNEYVQLAAIQNRQIDALQGELVRLRAEYAAYEEKSAQPISPAVPEQASPAAGANRSSPGSAGSAGNQAVGSP